MRVRPGVLYLGCCPVGKRPLVLYCSQLAVRAWPKAVGGPSRTGVVPEVRVRSALMVSRARFHLGSLGVPLVAGLVDLAVSDVGVS